jgi:hypothetical protein
MSTLFDSNRALMTCISNLEKMGTYGETELLTEQYITFEIRVPMGDIDTAELKAFHKDMVALCPSQATKLKLTYTRPIEESPENKYDYNLGYQAGLKVGLESSLPS